MDFLIVLGGIFGWLYFFSWSATFWPQVLLIHRRGTTAGYSTDFAAINIVGFVSYCIFTFSSYSIPAVTESYIANTGFPPQVELNDVLFASHGALMCAILMLQLFLLPPRTPPNRYVLVSVLIAQTLVLLWLFACLSGGYDWFKFLRFAGMVKVMSSLVKHFPQVMLNRARGSTVGWSFTMVVLDTVGGAFSLAQQVVRSISMGNLAPFTSNLAKTILAAETLAFDIWFIAQHLVWYTDRTDRDVDSKEADFSREKVEERPLV